MFFMMGIMPGQKELSYTQTVICDRCGQYGRYMVYMTYTVLSLFFIPVFKWGKKYYVKMSCCGASYELDREVGRQIERGQDVEIRPGDLELIRGQGYDIRSAGKDSDDTVLRCCPNCGFTTEEDYDFCPKCGSRLD